jgi:hypothetical protein
MAGTNTTNHPSQLVTALLHYNGIPLSLALLNCSRHASEARTHPQTPYKDRKGEENLCQGNRNPFLEFFIFSPALTHE